jgi:hypothetical protein
VPGEVLIKVSSMLDSVPPQRALLSASIESLKAFEKTAKREETLLKPNAAGAQSAYVWRTGTGANGAMASFDAVCLGSDVYVTIAWRNAGEASADLRKALLSLLDVMAVEPAP